MAWAKVLYILGQVQAPDQPLSQDLRWLRFPHATPESITMLLVVLLAIVLTVIVTLLVQGAVQRLLDKIPRRARARSIELVQRLDPDLREVLDRLKPDAGTRHVERLLADPMRFEEAVARHVARAPLGEDLSGFERIRRRLLLTVMNPAVEVVSTRQLLPNLTVRILAAIGPEKLDLYCPLLDVTERHLLIDVPYQKEIYDLLSANPDVFLLYWRESGGEAAFKVHLMPVHSGHLSAFQCEHAMRSEETAARTDFRLTVDMPVTYQFLDLEALAARRQGGEVRAPIRGEGRLVDLSYGGAAFLSGSSLAEHGFAQLHFTLNERPMRLMLEVLTQTAEPDGKTLVRGRFRGAAPELSGALHGFLSQEQYKRVMAHPALKVEIGKEGPAASAPAPGAAVQAPPEPAAAREPRKPGGRWS